MAVSTLARVAGGETALLRLLPELERRGWACAVTVPGRGGVADAAGQSGITVRRLPLGAPERRTAASYAGAVLAPLALRGADALFLNGLPAQRAVAGRGRRAPAVLRVNNPLPEPPAAWRGADRWRRIAHVVADSEYTARECVAAGAPEERVVAAYPPAFEGDTPPGRRPGAAQTDAGPRVGFVGQLEPRKGVLELVSAAGDFLQASPDASLTVIGATAPGAARFAAEVRAAAAALPMADRVELAGWRQDAAGELGSFDVVVVPSLAEPFGTVAAEAAAAGVPVVASRVGGLPEVVLDGETGLLVEPGDARALSEAVVALLGDAALRDRLGGRALELAGRFSATAYAERIDALLRSAVHGGAR